MPVNAGHAIVLAGSALAAADGLAPILKAVLAARSEVVRGLREQDAAAASQAPASAGAEKRPGIVGDIETLLQSTDSPTLSEDDIDSYWEAAAAQHGNKPTSDDVIPYEEARKMGLTPDVEEK